MLRLPLSEAAGLADAVSARTGGNPYDTVELVNALRRDGALLLGEAGWRWDAAPICLLWAIANNRSTAFAAPTSMFLAR